MVTARYVELPSCELDEIKKMVSWQAMKQLPSHPDDIISDFRIIHQDKEKNNSYIMMVIASAFKVKQLIEILSKAKLTPTQITLSSEGLLNWYLSLKQIPIKQS